MATVYPENLKITKKEFQRTLLARPQAFLSLHGFEDKVLEYCNQLRTNPVAVPLHEDGSLDLETMALVVSDTVEPIILSTLNYSDREAYKIVYRTLDEISKTLSRERKRKNPQGVANIQVIGETCGYRTQV